MNELEMLQQYMLPGRKQRHEDILIQRTSSIRVVIENLHKEHNVDAVLRTCEAFGIQHVHVLPQAGDQGILRTITRGCDRWLTIHRHLTLDECFRDLKGLGFRILAGAFGPGTRPVDAIDWNWKVALVFSNERDGACPEVLENADGLFVVPLHGFSRSLNVSVAAGITIHYVRSFMEKAGTIEGLSDPEKDVLRNDWSRKSVKNSKAILDELRRRG
ncbi:tRNA (guanosine(18)-2'-O)-methyltransferase [bacterium BMS3Abin14]|nr:tRNA (guanosine(18)-2'-O)-methyltransferase [bacterium BMS3Abin14]